MNGHIDPTNSGMGEHLDTEFEYQSPLSLFENKKLVKICAPMVRYSK